MCVCVPMCRSWSGAGLQTLVAIVKGDSALFVQFCFFFQFYLGPMPVPIGFLCPLPYFKKMSLDYSHFKKLVSLFWSLFFIQTAS